MDLSVFERAQRLQEAGEAFVLATVVRAVSPTSSKPGDRALITADGTVHGWVGGSCAEPAVKKQATEALKDGKARLLQITPEVVTGDSRPGMVVVPMTCYSGGTLEIYLEPNLAKAELLIFGNSPVAQALVSIGNSTEFLTISVDITERPPLEGAARRLTDLKAVKVRNKESAFVVVATHGVFDEQALGCALDLAPAYIGVVASAKRFGSLRESLIEAGACKGKMSKVKGPAGLNIGAKTPEEVALSILAQITQTRRTTAEAPPVADIAQKPELKAVMQAVEAAPAKGSCCSS